MSTPKSHRAYEDIFDVLDKALQDPQGVRVPFEDVNDARYFRLRLYTARQIDRMRSKEVYEPEDPKYGISIYDKLVARVRVLGERVFLYIEHQAEVPGVESLSEVQDGHQEDGSGVPGTGEASSSEGTGDAPGADSDRDEPIPGGHDQAHGQDVHDEGREADEGGQRTDDVSLREGEVQVADHSVPGPLPVVNTEPSRDTNNIPGGTREHIRRRV